MSFFDDLQIWMAKQAYCVNSDCPVPIEIRKKRCNLYEIAGDINASTLDIIIPDFLNDDGVQAKMKKEHCVGIVSQIPDWDGANYNKGTGNIDRF